MELQVHMHIASVQKLGFITYMGELLDEYGCSCSPTQPWNITDMDSN